MRHLHVAVKSTWARCAAMCGSRTVAAVLHVFLLILLDAMQRVQTLAVGLLRPQSLGKQAVL